MSFSPNGYHLASGGEDNLCRIWDLRMRKSLYTIPAHSNLISQVKFEPQEGYFLVTASYDMKVKVRSCRPVSRIHPSISSCLFLGPWYDPVSVVSLSDMVGSRFPACENAVRA